MITQKLHEILVATDVKRTSLRERVLEVAKEKIAIASKAVEKGDAGALIVLIALSDMQLRDEILGEQSFGWATTANEARMKVDGSDKKVCRLGAQIAEAAENASGRI